jgi:hypothetical protein
MKHSTSLIVLLIASFVSFSQNPTNEYLKDNKQDLRQNPSIGIKGAKIIGFGALHGSAKTELTEQLILTDLIQHQNLKYYFPETDYSTAHSFQKFIDNGDEQLLEDLIYEYGKRVPQEDSIEVFNKWKSWRLLFKEHQVQIIGIDKIASYKYSIKELLELTDSKIERPELEALEILQENPNTNWTAYYETETRLIIQNFISNFEQNKAIYFKSVIDTFAFNHIIKNIKLTFEKSSREHTIYNNYKTLAAGFKNKESLHFFRYGVFHLMKSKINGSSSFFNQLIENKDYSNSEVIVIQGFLTKSKVLWDAIYDKQGKYSRYTSKAGFGISDYWLEYYKGIKNLKSNRLSDITLFNLKNQETPYSLKDDYQLLIIEKLFGKSYWNPEPGKSTIDYFDYAILISNSEANKPIEELK